MTQSERDETLIKLSQAVLGNGVKGLCERQDDTDEWQDKHEEEHRATIANNQAYREKREEKEEAEEKAKKKRILAAAGAVGLMVLSQLLPLLLEKVTG